MEFVGVGRDEAGKMFPRGNISVKSAWFERGNLQYVMPEPGHFRRRTCKYRA